MTTTNAAFNAECVRADMPARESRSAVERGGTCDSHDGGELPW